jgi:hypothetical protein
MSQGIKQASVLCRAPGTGLKEGKILPLSVGAAMTRQLVQCRIGKGTESAGAEVRQLEGRRVSVCGMAIVLAEG